MSLATVILIFSLSLLLTAGLLLFIRFQNSTLRRLTKVLAAISIFIFTYNVIDHFGSPKPFTPDYNPTVYITETGTKYHAIGCGYLRNSSSAVNLCEAVASDYSICSKCDPPIYEEETISQILKSRESCIPPFNVVISSWSYIIPGFILALIMVLFVYFKIDTKLEAVKNPIVSNFILNAAILLGIFYLPVALFGLVVVYTLVCMLLAIFGFFWQFIEPVYTRISKKLQQKQIQKRNLSNPVAEEILYMEAANGMIVRVPASRLETWEAEQDKIRNGEAPELTEAEQRSIDRILDRIYGPKNQ